jgi:D-ribose pyranose/furanose isomerase RbsD
VLQVEQVVQMVLQETRVTLEQVLQVLHQELQVQQVQTVPLVMRVPQDQVQ